MCSSDLLRAVAADYLVRPVAGSDNIGDGGPVKLALLQQAEGLTSDAAGNLYIAEAAGHRVRRVSTSGQITTYVDGLGAPYGIAMAATGELYVADIGQACVWKIGPSGRQALSIPGLKAPRNVALDSSGALYVSDFDAGRVEIGRAHV